MQGYTIICNNLSKEEMEDVINLKSSKVKRPLGSGATAKVYSFPDKSRLARKWVYRIQNAPFDYYVEPYFKFATACISSKSRHLPRVKFIAVKYNKYKEISSVISVIERLDDWREHYMNEHYHWSDDIERFMNNHPLDTRLSRGIIRSKGYTYSSIHHVRNVFYKHNVEVNDLHAGNVMVRRDGTIVITDPSS